MANEVRLIDANALLQKISRMGDYCQDNGLEDEMFAIFQVGDAVIDCPTIDPESLRPVGRWVMKETMIRSPYAKNAYCSECLVETSYAHKFCPNCGAKMEV